MQDALKRRFEASVTELDKLLVARKRHPMTYNHYYTMTIQKMRRERTRTEIEEAVNNSTTTVYDRHEYTERKDTDPEKLLDGLCSQLDLDMDKHSCKEL